MATSNSLSVDLTLTAGLPYNRRIRVTGAAALWPTEGTYEVRSNLRSGRFAMSPLIADLTPFLSSHIDGMDIVVDLALTGEDTRKLSKGYYDIILSDQGPGDARALSILSGKVKVGSLVTAAADV